MKVLGLDPGSRHFGWGVVEKDGTRLRHVAHGVIDVNLDGEFAQRLVEIERALVVIIADHAPAAASIESLFFAKDAQAAAKLGHARGVALLVCARSEMPTFEYAPALVKRAVAGNGRAEKAQVAAMIRVYLKLTELPRPDAADALAIAVTHLQQLPLIEATARAAARMSPRSAAAIALLSSTKSGRGHKRRGWSV